jgi:lysophospholipase L1-like esterase
MKNASGPKAKKPVKRQRSKHKMGRQRRTRIEVTALAVSLCLCLAAALVVIATDMLKLSIVQVGLPIEGGVYQINRSDQIGQDFMQLDLAVDSPFADRYQISHNSSEEYTIRNVYSNLVLTGVIGADRQLSYEFTPSDGSCAQRWLMSFESSGSRLISTCDVLAESQILQFRAAGDELKLPDPAKPTVESGLYAFEPSANPQGVLQNLDLPSLQIVEKDNSPRQLFELAYDGLGYYNIYNLDLELYLDVSAEGDLVLNGEKLPYCGQMWAIIPDGQAYKIASSCTGRVLGALDGVNVGTISAVDDISALWRIENRRTLLFVGDSITYGQTNCNYGSNYCRLALSSAVDTEMSILNRDAINYIEINLGNPGATASGYLYGMNEAYLSEIRQYRIDTAQIMLGTNDSVRGVSTTNYIKNMSGIIDTLLAAGVKTVIVNRPIYNAVSPWRLSEYSENLATLANGETVFIGDTQAYDWFRQNSSHLDGGGGGFHPDQTGYRVLGELWATAFQSIVENSAP